MTPFIRQRSKALFVVERVGVSQYANDNFVALRCKILEAQEGEFDAGVRSMIRETETY
jgi:hypothetical protein